MAADVAVADPLTFGDTNRKLLVRMSDMSQISGSSSPAELASRRLRFARRCCFFTELMTDAMFSTISLLLTDGECDRDDDDDDDAAGTAATLAALMAAGGLLRRC